VWPGVDTIRGEPGTASVPSSPKVSTAAIGLGKNARAATNPATTGSAFGFVAT
jgi:hypothetical protein